MSFLTSVGGKRFELFTAPSFRRYSQRNEDGIIEDIFRQIGVTDRRFPEIGVGAGIENNTRYLAETGWSGLWIDAGPLQIHPPNVVFIHEWVTVENIIGLIRQSAWWRDGGEFDLLSLDIDGNDFWVLHEILAFNDGAIRPRVICLEYNGCVPPVPSVSIEYTPHLQWNGSKYFGASLGAFEWLLTDSEGPLRARYVLAGCDPTRTNAFFIHRNSHQKPLPKRPWRLGYPCGYNTTTMAADGFRYPSSKDRCNPMFGGSAF